MTTSSAPNDLPADIQKWLGEAIVEESEIPVEDAQIENFCAAVEDGNPIYRDTTEAQQLSGGRIAPPSLLSTFTRPPAELLHGRLAAGATAVHRPLELHFRLKDLFALPKAVVISAETTYYGPVRPGMRIRAEQVLDDVEGPSETSLGKGRKWTLSVHYRSQDGALLGIERLRFFAYGSAAGQ
jgi:acyl dehydratase